MNLVTPSSGYMCEIGILYGRLDKIKQKRKILIRNGIVHHTILLVCLVFFQLVRI